MTLARCTGADPPDDFSRRTDGGSSRNPSPVLGLSEEALRGRRLALLQAALLEHTARHNLKTVMTFHQRVEEAAAFAEKLPETAAELNHTEASDKALKDAEELPKSSIDAELYDLDADRHVPPDCVWVNWLNRRGIASGAEGDVGSGAQMLRRPAAPAGA